MNNSILLTVLAGAAAGVAGAVVTTIVVSPGASDGTPPPVIDDGAVSLQRDVAALIEEKEDLLARVRALEERPLAPEPARTVAPVEPTAEQIELENQMRAVVSALTNPKSEVPAVLRDSVASALTEIRAQEQLDRAERRRQQAQERMDERMVQLTERLGLDPYQATEMRTILDKQAAVFEEMRSARGDGNWSSMRETVTKLRDETNQALSSLLTPEQYEKYQQTGGRFGMFGGRGDRGGGRRGGSGGSGGNGRDAAGGGF